MAKGREKHQERQRALLALGTPLSRRASSKCELCSTAGVSLRPLEVLPEEEEPRLERCILICAACTPGTQGDLESPERWRFLEEVAWSELPPLQVTAVRMLRAMESSEPWAASALELLYLSPEVSDWLDP